jgi:hypothetical protein
VRGRLSYVDGLAEGLDEGEGVGVGVAIVAVLALALLAVVIGVVTIGAGDRLVR